MIRLKELFGIPFILVKLYFNKVMYQRRTGDNKVKKTIPLSVCASDELIATEWIIAVKLWNFKNKRQNQLVVTYGDELIPLNKINKFIYFLIMRTYIHISATPLPYYVWNPWNRRIFSHGITLLGNFHILSNMLSLLIPIDTIKTCLCSFHLRKPE